MRNDATKKGYPTMQAAFDELVRIERNRRMGKGNGRRRETRLYRSPHTGRYHLTSQPARKGAAKAEVEASEKALRKGRLLAAAAQGR